MTRPPKARVRQSFERAAATYDSAADVQRLICDRLLKGLPNSADIQRALDAGCGTGYAQSLLRQRYPAAELISLDLSAAMLKRIASPCQRIAGDLEHLPLADRCIDLYWSSLAVQWCDLPKALREARRVLRPHSHLALATLGPTTFHELRTAFSRIDDYRHTLSFHSPADIASEARQSGFSAVNSENHQEIAYYPDLRSLLHAVKAVGANQLGSGRRTGLMSRSTLCRVEDAYETMRQPAGLPLTYDIISLHAQS
jgi:malonyl-CoA O-methyltransferase